MGAGPLSEPPHPHHRDERRRRRIGHDRAHDRHGPDRCTGAARRGRADAGRQRHVFEDQVALKPQAVAVQSPQGDWTYAQGEVKLFFTVPTASTLEFTKQGKVKVLGVTSAQASPLIAGAEPIGKYVPGYVQDINFAVWGPPGLPAPVLAKVSEAIRVAMTAPEIKERLNAMAMSPAHSDPGKLVSITEHEVANIKRAMEVATIKYGE